MRLSQDPTQVKNDPFDKPRSKQEDRSGIDRARDPSARPYYYRTPYSKAIDGLYAMKSEKIADYLHISLWASCILFVFLSSGAVHAGSSLVVSGLSLIGLILSYVTLKWRDSDAHSTEGVRGVFVGWGVCGWLLIALIVLTAMQLIPLPLSLLSHISPQTAQNYTETCVLLDGCTSWPSVTLSKAATGYGLSLLVGFFAFYAFTLLSFQRFKSYQRAYHALVLIGVILVLFNILAHFFNFGHSSTGSSAWFRFGLIINDNHASVVWGLFAFLCLGAVTGTKGGKRGVWLVLYVLFSAALFMKLSRAAIAAWTCSHGIMAILYWVRSKKTASYGVIIIMAAFAISVACIYLFLSSTLTQVSQSYTQTHWFEEDYQEQGSVHSDDFEKTYIYRDLPEMMLSYPLGTGRQTFSDIFPQYQSRPYPKHFYHAEQEYFEILIEYGPVFGFFILALIVYLFVFFIRQRPTKGHERGIELGLLTGIMFFAIQNAFDFNARYWVGAILALAYAGMLCARQQWRVYKNEQSTHDIASPKSLRFRQIMMYSGLCAVGLALIPMTMYFAPGVAQYRRTLLPQVEEQIRGLSPGVDQAQWISLHRDMIQNNVANAALKSLVGYGLVFIGKKPKHKQALISARQWYLSAIQQAPQEHGYYLLLGQLQRYNGEELEAAQLFARSADLDLKPSLTAMELAATLKLEVIGSAAPQNAEDRIILSRYLAKEKRFAEMLILAGSLNGGKSKAIDAYLIEYEAYQMMHFETLARELVEQMGAEFPHDLRFVLTYLDSLIREKKIREAFELMHHERETFKNSAEFSVQYAKLCIFYGNEWDAQNYFTLSTEALEALHPFIINSANIHAQYHWLQAEFHVRIGEKKRAKSYLHNSLKVNPQFVRAQKLLDSISAE